MSDKLAANSGYAVPPYEIKGLANLILDWAAVDRISITPMKLQKIIYFCHEEYIFATGLPLVIQEFQAWEFGPVEPSLFEEFKDYSKSNIEKRAFRFDPITASRVLASINIDDNVLEFVRGVYDFYKYASAKRLSDITHEEGGAWVAARNAFEAGQNMDRRMSSRLIHSFHKLRNAS